MQIRYLETLQHMSNNAGTKVIFMPTDGGAGMDMTKAVIHEKLADN